MSARPLPGLHATRGVRFLEPTTPRPIDMRVICGQDSPRRPISSLAAAPPARLAPIVEADGP